MTDTMLGPRVPGGRYHNGYWNLAYEVEAVGSNVETRGEWVRCRWSDGEVTTHCTPWDARCDHITTRGD